MKILLALWCLAVLCGCGSSDNGGSSTTPAPLASGSFWAVDFTSSTSSATAYYPVNATKVAEGSHCQIFLEQGGAVSPQAIEALRSEFDNAIYPGLVAAFGSEPNPGIDGDPKLYILLLNVRDGFNPTSSSSFIAGYFDPLSEFALTAQNPNSNQKEILFLNINPATGVDPASISFFETIAHEFQHVIHWEQKAHQRNVLDDTWLDEAMSTVARTYCGYGPDYSQVLTYQHAPADSLTGWNNTLEDYAVVYMWAQYFKDRVGSGIFRTMLQNSQTGIDSVSAALAAAGYPKDFTGTFRDWAVANYVGNGTTVPVPQNNPAWSYLSINTWPGSYTFNDGQDRVTLPGLFPLSRQDRSTLDVLGQWSVNYYSYTPSPSPPHTVTWSPANPAEKGTFADAGSGSLTFDMTAGTPASFTTTGYLIAQNPSGTSSGSGASVIRSELAPVTGGGAALPAAETASMTPPQILHAANGNPLARKLATLTGRPQPVSVHAFLREREKALRATGARPPF